MSDLDSVHLSVLSPPIVSPQYYKALNIRVALIGLEVWTDQDKIGVSDNPHSTLAAFLSWRRKELKNLPNDNAQLVTSVSLAIWNLIVSPKSFISVLPLTALLYSFVHRVRYLLEHFSVYFISTNSN